ncbi:hypothetical protein L2Y96_10740 [Luteibacter aegosomaticola]|jgi:hypothetical protein|uniref:hypothetical protein n=1 Tax=Luteibacter aegosomaticola TaxID=2911538 RepID=UPI001FF7BD78|nr:hypothetical protein [Luteibacter aegosomaticola]UPG92215.1 hypothetical protein L2Y96_10740 [Luteibacter aegosomaticola]
MTSDAQGAEPERGRGRTERLIGYLNRFKRLRNKKVSRLPLSHANALAEDRVFTPA